MSERQESGSVVSDGAVRAAERAWSEAYHAKPTTPHDDHSWMRAALEAAEPHLAASRSLRAAQLRQEFRSEIMRGYQAALCNSQVPGWTLGDEVGKVADKLLALITQGETQ
jgi:hypothetical protein